MDLPGIYSLSPYTLEEVVARNYLIGERPDAILNLVDGTNIERNLYLSTQLMELGIPVVMAVNMIDIVNKNGDKINVGKLSEKLGCPVVEISALKLTGIENATRKAIELAQKKSAAAAVHKFAPEVESVIETVEKKLTDVPEEQKRFFAIKLLEKDDKIPAQMKSVPDVSAEIKQLETAEESIIDESCYMQVIRKKTAMLLSACAEIGSISAGASGEMVEKCREFGEYLGYCFQIKDDIFDYFKEANIGKPTGNDIREGKVTLPLLHALQTGRREEAEHCLHIINEKDFTTENIDLLIDFAKANGGIEYAEQRMQVYHDKAVEVLMTLPESEAREGLLLLADYIVERRK